MRGLTIEKLRIAIAAGGAVACVVVIAVLWFTR